MRPGRLLALLQKSSRTDRRSIKRANEAAALVADNPELFAELISLLWSEKSVVNMRAADAAEKVTRKLPALLEPHKKELLGLMAESNQQEICWHLAAMIPRLNLSRRERLRVAARFGEYLEHPSSIVRTFSLQGLADLARQEPSLRPRALEALQEAERTGTPAMKARSRKLLLQLAKE